jgi:hypothetical protein
MVTGLFSQIGDPVDETHRGQEIRELEAAHQLIALDLPLGECGQVRSDFRGSEWRHEAPLLFTISGEEWDPALLIRPDSVATNTA